MPGKVLEVLVSEGQSVSAGATLMVLEAMKMENSLRATQDAVVAKCLANVGENLVAEQSILEFE